MCAIQTFHMANVIRPGNFNFDLGEDVKMTENRCDTGL